MMFKKRHDGAVIVTEIALKSHITVHFSKLSVMSVVKRFFLFTTKWIPVKYTIFLYRSLLQ